MRSPRPTRRQLIVGGGAGIGLLVGWAVWPRDYPANLLLRRGEAALSAYAKIGSDGIVTVALPQSEMGQGTGTLLAQIFADELGADWDRVAIEPAPPSPHFANLLFARETWSDGWAPEFLVTERARREMLAVTAGSTQMRGLAAALREAGATARALLCRAAASRWDADWRDCDTAKSYVVLGERQLSFAALAEAAARLDPPRRPPLRTRHPLAGRSVPRLDIPTHVDGSLNYTADIRVPDLVYAVLTHGPAGRTQVAGYDRDAAARVPGFLDLVATDSFVATVAGNSWAAAQALQAARPRFRLTAPVDDRAIAHGLATALAAPGERIATSGDADAAGGSSVSATYSLLPAPHAGVETASATARYRNGLLELWLATQAPEQAAQAAARAAGLARDRVRLQPLMVGGSFGARYETDIAAEAALLAIRLGRPVQLTYQRSEEARRDRPRPPALVRLTGRATAPAAVEGWRAAYATPATHREWRTRVFEGGGESLDVANRASGRADALSLPGAVPPYAIRDVAVDHHPAEIGLPTGDWRGRGHVLSAFANECFVDELAEHAGVDPFSFRIGLLADNPRLAACLSRVAAIGGWSGGAKGSAEGLACYAMADGYCAVLARATLGADGRVRVERLAAAVDCGQVVNPAIVRQQIAGGMIFGLGAATGAPFAYRDGSPPIRYGALRLPRLADAPAIVVELIASRAPSGEFDELSVPPTAPAIANALFAATGRRLRTLPLVTT